MLGTRRDPAHTADFQAGGTPPLPPFRFVWHVDPEKIRLINRKVGMGPNENKRRGFLSRCLVLWLRIPPDLRPPLEVPETLGEDLFYIPSPSYVFARSEDGTRWLCWYKDAEEADLDALLHGREGVLVFSVEGAPADATRSIAAIMERFGFAPAGEKEGHTFYVKSEV